MKNEKLLETVQMTVLLAIVVIMAFTPIGYLRLGVVSISFLTIPVAIGAIIIGPRAGAVLGAAFGLTSFVQGFGLEPFGTMLMSINPFLLFIVCVPTRTLMGFLTGKLFEALYKRDKTKTVSFFVTGALAAVFNTVFFMFTLVACFWHTEYLQELNKSLGGQSVLLFIVMFVGINFVFEVIASAGITGTITKVLYKTFHKNQRRS